MTIREVIELVMNIIPYVKDILAKFFAAKEEA